MEPVTARHLRSVRWDDAEAGIARGLEGRSPTGVIAYRLTLEPPLSRHFSLADQIRRAAPSVPANVAEGYGLATKPQFVRCLRIALDSAMELRTHLEIVQELELFAKPEPVAEALQRCERLIGLIIGLIRSLVARP